MGWLVAYFKIKQWRSTNLNRRAPPFICLFWKIEYLSFCVSMGLKTQIFIFIQSVIFHNKKPKSSSLSKVLSSTRKWIVNLYESTSLIAKAPFAVGSGFTFQVISLNLIRSNKIIIIIIIIIITLPIELTNLYIKIKK